MLRPQSGNAAPSQGCVGGGWDCFVQRVLRGGRKKTGLFVQRCGKAKPLMITPHSHIRTIHNTHRQAPSAKDTSFGISSSTQASKQAIIMRRLILGPAAHRGLWRTTSSSSRITTKTTSAALRPALGAILPSQAIRHFSKKGTCGLDAV